MVPWNWCNRLHRPGELIPRHHGMSHIIYLWSALLNHNKAYFIEIRKKEYDKMNVQQKHAINEKQWTNLVFHVGVNRAIHALIKPKHIG